MADSRIFTTDGKSTGGAKKFGMTVKDRQDATHPNMAQTTIIPASGTVQNHRFVLGAVDSDGMTASNTLTISPDLTLTAARFYQFHAHITIIVQHADGGFYTGHYSMTSAAKGATALIGSGNGYRLDTICSETGMDNFFDETNITLAVIANKFIITITAADTITTSVDMLADISINSAVFTP